MDRLRPYHGCVSVFLCFCVCVLICVWVYSTETSASKQHNIIHPHTVYNLIMQGVYCWCLLLIFTTRGMSLLEISGQGPCCTSTTKHVISIRIQPQTKLPRGRKCAEAIPVWVCTHACGQTERERESAHARK